LFIVSLIFTKQTITKFTNNELMQKIFIAKFRISVKGYNIIAFTILLPIACVLNHLKCNTTIACWKLLLSY